MRIDSSGNVGIGTSSPSQKLTLQGAQLTIPAAGWSSGQVAYNYLGDTNGGIRATNGGNVGVFAYNGFDVTVNGVTPVTAMTVTSGANVGIGTSSPGYKLVVNGGDFLVSRGSGAAAADAAINFGGNANNYIYSGNSSNIMAFATNGSERMRITNNGSVGIGTSSPQGLLHVVAGTNDTLVFRGPVNLGTGGSIYAVNSANSAVTPMEFGASVYSFAGGNVGIGTTSPGSTLSVVFNSTVHNGMRVTNNSTTQYAGSGLQMLGPSAAGTQGGAAVYYYNTNAGGTNGALGIAQVDYTGNFQRNLAYYDYSGQYWGFLTNSTERLRIDSSGNLLVGTTSAGLVNSHNYNYTVGSGRGYYNHVTGTGSGADYLIFGYATGQIGSITQNGTTGVLYNITSDARLKHDIVDAPEASSLIDAIKVRSFKWNADNSEQRYGMVAQELLEVAPEAVSVPADEEQMMGVDYSKLVPMLIKEIQSLRARVAQLEGN